MTARRSYAGIIPLVVRLFAPALALCASVTARPARAQDSLVYERGRLTRPFLPFSQPFLIKGSAWTQDGDLADLVLVREMLGERRHGPVSPGSGIARDSACWARRRGPAAAQDTIFRLWLNKPLLLARSYRFDFSFARLLHGADSSSRAEAIVTSAIEGLAHAWEPGVPPKPGYVDDALDSAMVSAARHVVGTPRWITVAGEGQCTVGTAPVHRRLSDEGRASLVLGVANVRVSVGVERPRIDRAVARLRAVGAASVGAALHTLRMAHAEVLAADSTAIQAAYGAAIQQKFDGPLAADVVSHMQSALMDTTTAAMQQVMTDLSTFGVASQKVTAAVADVKARSTELASAFDGYALVLSSADVAEVAWGDSTAVRSLQVGTAVGGGLAVLNGGKGGERDGSFFVALRYYLDAVDRTLPNPWSSRLAHWAVDLGALAGHKLLFHGQQQADFGASITPLLGLSYDVNRRVAITAAALFFRQPNVNKADTAGQPVRVAPFFGVSFDADALNLLKKLIPSGS